MTQKLNLGCGLDLRDGWINHDRVKHNKHVHKAHDLNVLPWPWGASTIDQIDAMSVFEHLEIDLITTLNSVLYFFTCRSCFLSTSCSNSSNSLI